MRDFALAISGVLIGGLITLGANVVLSNITTKKEARAELRGKLETLYQQHLADRGCHLNFLQNGKETDRCAEGQFHEKADSLANIYFPIELSNTLSRFSTASQKGKLARLECDIKFPSQSQTEVKLKCSIEVLTKFKVHKESADIAYEVNQQAQRLRSE